MNSTRIKALLFGAAATGGLLLSAPTAVACEPGFYPTDTAGVCSDNPPANRPKHVQPKDLPAPIQGALTPGHQGQINTWLDSDGDGWNDNVDRAPSDPYRH